MTSSPCNCSIAGKSSRETAGEILTVGVPIGVGLGEGFGVFFGFGVAAILVASPIVAAAEVFVVAAEVVNSFLEEPFDPLVAPDT
jgi:uncharacterized membrane protein YgaE (UPF0421/DUF939 family)